ncbi:MAG: hypothetical protein ACK541_02575 [Burkholderiales bacterium]
MVLSTRHPPPATRHPPPATRHPPPATRARVAWVQGDDLVALLF